MCWAALGPADRRFGTTTNWSASSTAITAREFVHTGAMGADDGGAGSSRRGTAMVRLRVAHQATGHPAMWRGDVRRVMPHLG